MVNKTMTITIFHKLILNYYSTLDQTYSLLYNTSMCQVVTSNIDKETKGLIKL